MSKSQLWMGVLILVGGACANEITSEGDESSWEESTETEYVGTDLIEAGEACNIFAQNCAVGKCYWVNATQGQTGSCQTEGTLSIAKACTTLNAGKAGLACHVGYTKGVCQNNAGCDVWEPVVKANMICRTNVGMGTGVGYCQIGY